MAETKADIKSGYPLPSYNYRVILGGKDVIGFSEVSGLELEYEPVSYKHGLSFRTGGKIIPGMRGPIELTMNKGIVKDKDYLSKWISEVYGNPFSLGRKRDVLVQLCDELGKPVVAWHVKDALPVKLSAPTFEADSNEVAMETMELVAHGLRIDYDP
uniref:Conserved hypothetical phage tail region protein n=1 Tax=Candidatus Kentrum sp. SD TaxID=2126332 RepID=A0A450YC93_9GAMM|nr:MAG: conserved hypothetical phage tail region protein [Candidatus Kentron sp. SD]VFK39162.1 MAG: conserved hypothetical phage tail region protein [Candidatus Kentron sp. SD]VFK77810.1 MAG: conserved hypothetical phage tail region protein [Candidatus Kentron sp. SD]